jgi:hypothetical protein
MKNKTMKNKTKSRPIGIALHDIKKGQRGWVILGVTKTSNPLNEIIRRLWNIKTSSPNVVAFSPKAYHRLWPWTKKYFPLSKLP